MAMGTPSFLARHARAWQFGAHGMGATWFYRGRRIVESVDRAGSLVVLNLLTVADETMSEDVSLFCIAGSKN